MSKSRKQLLGRRSPRTLLISWLGVLLAAGLMYLLGRAVMAIFGSMHSCADNTIMGLNNCGKQSLNPGDLLMMILFALSVLLTFSAVTHAWRLIREAR